ncbi:CD209 antigen-like protein 2 [Rattus norvegicus]|uniref:CD209 antigen-like protein 2 n=1 Tax=Rattus norvegicus TaxID=10116 RepID=UPI002FD87774
MQLGIGVDSLCRPCPWEWTFFHRRCYYFSKSQRNWNDSVAACQEVDAQLVTVESDEEQTFLGVLLKNKSAWMGLSDLKQESTWQWVDGSPLSDRSHPITERGYYRDSRQEIKQKSWRNKVHLLFTAYRLWL